MDIEQLKYPIGKYRPPEVITDAQIKSWIEEIAVLPATLRQIVQNLSEAQLSTPYREGGWTIRQLVHHVPDSHMNAYTRFKLALTEDTPTIKPYMQSGWAELKDSQTTPVQVSLNMLDALHTRWVILLKGMSPGNFKRTFMHPEHKIEMPLDITLGMYAWHGKHHCAHIRQLKERMQW